MLTIAGGILLAVLALVLLPVVLVVLYRSLRGILGGLFEIAVSPFRPRDRVPAGEELPQGLSLRAFNVLLLLIALLIAYRLWLG
jgi:hypothetical protein